MFGLFSRDKNSALFKVARKGKKDKVLDLLKSGADPNKAIHIACIYGHTEVVNLLLDYGADINAQTSTYFQPIFHASARGHMDTVKILLERGANPQHAYLKDYEMEQLLKAYGFDKEKFLGSPTLLDKLGLKSKIRKLNLGSLEILSYDLNEAIQDGKDSVNVNIILDTIHPVKTILLQAAFDEIIMPVILSKESLIKEACENGFIVLNEGKEEYIIRLSHNTIAKIKDTIK